MYLTLFFDKKKEGKFCSYVENICLRFEVVICSKWENFEMSKSRGASRLKFSVLFLKKMVRQEKLIVQ